MSTEYITENGIEYRVETTMLGTKRWFLNGNVHRVDGPAMELADGSRFWYQNGKRHREDGPAVEYINGHEEWYQNGKRHREDGPAIEHQLKNIQEYHINGIALKHLVH